MKHLVLLVMLCVPVAMSSATTLEEVEVVCAVCGTTSEQVIVMSTNTFFGSSDLDLRPPEMMRSTMRYWVQQCPSCGYCNNDIGELATNAEMTIKTPEYVDTLGNEDTDMLVRRFLCLMQIMDSAGDTKAAVHAAICASWAGDDAEDEALSTKIRRLIVDRLDAIWDAGGAYLEQRGADQLLSTDIARRAGEFSRAYSYASMGIGSKPENTIDRILHYELELLARNDTGAHTVAEALGQ